MSPNRDSGKRMPLMSVVVPVYRAEATLDELYRRLSAALGSITADYEIILVEDCGGDRSWEIIGALAARDPRVKGLQFSRNFGQHYGITAGLDLSRGDWVVVMDCDLQDRPEEIPRLYAKALEGFEVVLARRGRRRDPLLKSLTSWFFYLTLNYLADMKYDPQVGNFRIVSRKVVASCCGMRERLRFFGGLVEWLGFPAASIDVEHAERSEGKSNYTVRKLVKLATDAIIAYSDKPLRMAVSLGFAMSLLAFGFAVYFFYNAIVHGSPVLGWSSLIVSLYFLAGIVISILGILGIYVGKIFDEVKGRPLYVVKERANV